MSDPFSVLGVAPGASEAEIRAAWRARAREHPPEADPAGFEAVRTAYDLIRDPEAFARHVLDAPAPQYPLPLRETGSVDVKVAARALLRHLIATGAIDLSDLETTGMKHG